MKSDQVYLRHILDAIARIEEYVFGIGIGCGHIPRFVPSCKWWIDGASRWQNSAHAPLT